ncbi:hypothetical protein ACI3LY_002014 [Candidozyma auris]|uniref:Pre-mRNA-splicing factor SYF2 n=1 Tax=Candidozyma auris TaxID=498019 RepID=A0A2H0ZKE5_CANAR|nr:hypothetical protein QG37_03957 [[Candida] auris]PIS51131.1 hypothetical protein B9J08_002704 [[Candida] auris]
MTTKIETQERLANARNAKRIAIRENAKAVAEDLRRQRKRSNAYKLEKTEHDDEAEPKSDLDYTLQEWKEWSEKHVRKNKSGGYKNLEELAHSTYEKEVSKVTVDKEKYTRVKEGKGTEDVENMVRGLEEATERRRKRRKKGVEETNSINEKNRQFNMKLERERENQRRLS